MKVRVDEMTPEQLNHAVALANGWEALASALNKDRVYCDWTDRKNPVYVDNYTPCTNAEQAYEIIERERIGVFPFYKNGAFYWEAHTITHQSVGDTALIAAMRCYVKSKLGDEVDL